jgi:lysophospholipase L1-like esterase
MVLSITNRAVTSDWIGGYGYNEIIAINNQLANIYGSHYLDVRQLLISHYDPALATDVSDYNHDDVPTSLRAIYGIGTLGSSIGQSDTSFTVNLTNGNLSVNSILTIDTGENAENVKITAVSGSTVTVTRNYGGLNAAHSAGAPVTEADYVHLNAKAHQIIANAVAQYLSAYDNPKQ